MSDRWPVRASVTDDPADRGRHGLHDDEVALMFRKDYGENNSATDVIRVTVPELRETRAAIDAYLAVHDTFVGT